MTTTEAAAAPAPTRPALVLVAGLSWAIGSWYQPRTELPRAPFVVAGYEMLAGGAMLTVIGLLGGKRFTPLTCSAVPRRAGG